MAPGSLRLVIGFLIRFLLLTAAVAMLTYGLAAWQHEGFGLDGVWLFGVDGRLHPLHFVVVGIGMIPPVMWEIFGLDTTAATRPAPAPSAGDDSAQTEGDG